MRLCDLNKADSLQMGDHVIGTTPGGFKIRASHGSEHPSYGGMKPADHVVAANMHAKAARDCNIKSATLGGSLTLKRQAANHLNIATQHRQAGTGAPQKLAASLAIRDINMQCVSLYSNVLQKAEGGRGGQVVGHTKSGKPIYARHTANYSTTEKNKGKHNAERVRWAYKEDKYSKQDHADAAAHHHERAEHFSQQGQKNRSAFYSRIAEAHRANA